MLALTVEIIPESWDADKQEFIPAKTQTLQLEHSLVSVKKWESKWNRSFLSSKQPMTDEETIDYIRCMTITQNVNPDVYNHISRKNVSEIDAYMTAPMTATTFNDRDKRGSSEIITAEVIYYWMITCGIPMECQKWHLNQLIALIRVCSIKNGPAKKMSKSEIARQNAALNASRRQRLNSKG